MTPHVKTLFTIGHSNHPLETFLQLLRQHEVEFLADVRSSPYSKYNHQFNREPFANSLAGASVKYVHWGDDLGARQLEPCYLEEGRVDFAKYTRSPKFQTALARLRETVQEKRVALMCAEKDPTTCHRMILVTRALRKETFQVRHIREDGALETPQRAEMRLLDHFQLPPGDLFTSKEEMIEQAYDRQAKEIAFVVDPHEVAQD